MTNTTIEWGAVGKASWGTPHFPSSGVSRKVEDRVDFLWDTPLKACGLPWWEDVPNEPRHYQMRWPEGSKQPWADDASQFASLEKLGDELRPLRLKIPADDARLDELDGAVQRLLHVVDQLHRHNARVGLLSPKSVVVQRGTFGQHLVLTDLGFVWQSAGSSRLAMRPPWVADKGPLATLWLPATPEQQQQPTLETPAERLHDLRVVARTLMYVLLGKPARQRVPTVAEVAETESDTWFVLASAEAGKYETAEAFAAELAKYPLRGHYLPKPSAATRSPAPRWPWKMALTASVLLVAVIGGTALLLSDSAPFALPQAGNAVATTPATEKSTQKPPPDVAHLKAELAGLDGLSLEQQGKHLKAAYEKPRHPDPQAAASEKALLEESRKKFVEECWRRFADLSKGPIPPGRKTVEAYRAVLELLAALQQLEAVPASPALTKEEKRCLGQMQKFLDSLE